jgi:hypothetical protein
MSVYLNAIKAGFGAGSILNSVAERSAQAANFINTARSAKYSAQSILRALDSKNHKEPVDQEEYLTEHEKNLNYDKRNQTEARLQALGLLGTAGAVAAGGYALYNQNRAVQPSQILPAQQERNIPYIPRPGRTININPTQPPGSPPPQKMLPAPRQGLPNRQPQLPYNPKNPQGMSPTRPKQPTKMPPSKQSGEPIIPPYTHNEKKNIQLVKSLGEDKKLATILKSGLEMPALMEVARENLPKLTLSVLERAPGGFEQALRDYQKHLLQTSSEEKRVKALSQFHNQIKQPSLVKQELQRFQDEYGEAPEFDNPQMQPQQNETQEQEPDLQEDVYEEPQQYEEEIEQQPEQTLENKTNQVALSSEKPKKISEVKPLKTGSFNIPNYHHKSEPIEEYVRRKKVDDVINKAAHLIASGKSFLDLPIQKGVAYSTASDVLKFIGGVPNILDDLLEPEEQMELEDVFFKEGGIYGTQMTPNLVWNMLLSIEPKISQLAPPSIKGSKGKPKGGKMNTTEMRRFLTHGVYDVLSGKKLSYELADKIEKVSSASSRLDAIARAAHAGNERKLEEELDRLSTDDAYFMQVMNSVEEMIKSPEQLQEEEEFAKEDAKTAGVLKASFTRQKKKEMK